MKGKILGMCLALGTAGSAFVLDATVAAAAATYSARGAVESIAPDRESVRIAHEAIPGYMPAMTMSFEVSAPGQLDGLAKGDRVRFSFTATDDGRRILGLIAKEPAK